MAERFSECLVHFMEIKQISRYLLAKRTGIDSALIYRYLHEYAVPSLQSDNPERIADKLGLTREERNRLEQAQIVSLKEPRPKHQGGKNPGQPAANSIPQYVSESSPKRRGQSKRILVISERRQALEKALELLEKLPDIHGKNVPPIFLTLQGQTIFRSVPGLHERWQAVRVQVLQRGWTIRHLWRFDFNIFRHVNWVNDILVALEAGDYQPYFFDDQKGLLEPPYEILLLPGGPAVLFFATTSARNVDVAVFVESPEFIEVLAAHMNLLKEQTQPVLTLYPLGERQRFMAAQENEEALLGERLVVKKDFAGTTRPISFYQGDTPWTRQARLEGADTWVMEHYQKRQEVFHRKMTLKQYVYRDMYSMRAIEAFVRTGKYSLYQSFGAELEVGSEWARKHVAHVIEMLQQYDQYQMAFLAEAEERLLPIEPWWEVVGRPGAFSVFIEAWYLDPIGKREMLPIDVQITEQRLVKAFMAHFDDFWNRIPRERKDKKYVIPWLESLLQ